MTNSISKNRNEKYKAIDEKSNQPKVSKYNINNIAFMRIDPQNITNTVKWYSFLKNEVISYLLLLTYHGNIFFNSIEDH